MSKADDYDGVWARLEVSIPALVVECRNRRASARIRMRKLRRMTVVQRRLYIFNAEQVDVAVCAELIAEAKGAVHRDPAEALEWARLAVHAAGRCECPELDVEAAIELANAYRAGGELALANQVVTWTRRQMLAAPVDPLVEARFYSVAASLHDQQRRGGRAVVYLRRSLRLLVTGGARREDFARALVKLSPILTRLDDPQSGYRVAAEAWGLLGQPTGPLHLYAAHNIAYALSVAGRTEDADKVIRGAAPLYARFGAEGDLLRRDWLSANIAMSRGELERASIAMEEVRDRYLERGDLYSAALVGTELGLAYLSQGRCEEAGELALALAASFAALDMPTDELLAASVLKQSREATALGPALFRAASRTARFGRRRA